MVGASEPARLAGRTRYCTRTHIVPFVADGAAFAGEIASLCELEAIDAVVPLADEMLGTLLVARPEDAAWQLVGPSRAVFGLVCDKAELSAVAERAGLGRPEQVVAGPGTPLTRLPPLPAYVKIVSGVTEGRAAGRPTRVTDEGACRSVVAELVADGFQVLVQEEIDGEQWRFHFARVGGATAHVTARTITSYPQHTGQSSVSEFGSTRPDVEAAATALLDAVGYEGIGSIQMIVRDGVWYPHDVNLRIPASVGGTVAAGLDLPRLGVEIALGRARPLRPVRPVGSGSFSCTASSRPCATR